MGWATGWATGLAHRVPIGIKTSPRPDPLGQWATHGLGRPLARWAVGFLGRVVGRELFDDPYNNGFEIIICYCFISHSMQPIMKPSNAQRLLSLPNLKFPLQNSSKEDKVVIFDMDNTFTIMPSISPLVALGWPMPLRNHIIIYNKSWAQTPWLCHMVSPNCRNL